MILNSVTVENFRSFYGEQTVNFADDPNKNTTIIYALNGVGKTNLLNAILWCLHGEFSLSFKNHNDVLNWEAARRGRKSYHASLYFEDCGQRYVVKRSGGDIENFKVFLIEDDGNIRELKGSPSMFVNSIIPKDMAGYFINDGESGDLKVTQNGTISIRRSIRDILGFNVAEKTLKDLATVKKEVRDELKKFDKDHELSKLEDRIQVLDDRLSNDKADFEENKAALELYHDKLDTVEATLGNSSSAVVDQLIKQRGTAQRDRASRSSKLASLESQKISLIREYSWVAFAHKLSGEALDFIDEAELKGTIPAPFNLQLVKDILDREECVCGACIKPGTSAFERINELTKEAADPDLLQRLQKARSRLTAIKILSPQAYDRIERNFHDVRTIQDEIQSLDARLDEISEQILQLDDEGIRQLEKDRGILKAKVRETERAVDRLDDKIKALTKERSSLQQEASRIQGLSPRAKLLKHKLNVIEGVEVQIMSELEKAEGDIHDILKEKIDSFLDKYLRQDYRVLITSDLSLCLQDRNGKAVPPSGGQGAILSFIYISSLIAIARERRDLESSILTPGAIAPLIFDAPFSNLDPKYAPNVARELPKLVDQLIILMYQDEGKNVTSTFLEEGKLGKEYYFCEQIAGEQGARDIYELSFGDQTVAVTEYGASADKIVVKEVVRNV